MDSRCRRVMERPRSPSEPAAKRQKINALDVACLNITQFGKDIDSWLMTQPRRPLILLETHLQGEKLKQKSQTTHHTRMETCCLGGGAHRERGHARRHYDRPPTTSAAFSPRQGGIRGMWFLGNAMGLCEHKLCHCGNLHEMWRRPMQRHTNQKIWSALIVDSHGRLQCSSS